MSTPPEPAAPPLSGSAVLRMLQAVLHAAFGLLLVIAVARLFADPEVGHVRWVALVGAAALGAVYAVGPLSQRQWTHPRVALVWLAVVTALWALLLLVSPDFSWVAFPLFFLHLHLLRWWHAVGAVAVITGLVVLTQWLHADTLEVAMLLGPVIGAVFAVVIALGYAALHAESEHRRRLIDDLTRTRAELAASEHAAGVATERERLAREIHDTLAQGLSSLVLLLRTAQNRAGSEEVASPIEEARQAAQDNLAEARRFVRDLSPPGLRNESLSQALGRLCERTAREADLDARFYLVGGGSGDSVTLPPGYDVALLRAAQASLANVTAHARAGVAVVTLSYLDAEVTLDVYDDGRGLQPDDEEPSTGDTGYGLPALRRRITALGGAVDVESAPGQGTVVAIRLPLTGEGDA